MSRLLSCHEIPETLWDASAFVLQLPPILAEQYVALLRECDLVDLANQRERNDSPVGGLTQELTDKHLAQAFDGSVARAELAILDPRDDIPEVSNMLLRCLAGNEICLVDAPSGSGAASLAFLCSVAELRARNVLPREPLRVQLLCGELSNPAREYCKKLVDRVLSTLESQAISVSTEFQHWDVTDSMSNTQLIQRMTLLSKSRKTLVVVANFNGFLERTGKRKEAKPQLEELFRHAAVGSVESGNAAVCIEPKTNRVISSGGTFNWLQGLLKTAWRLFARDTSSNGGSLLTSSAHFQDPLDQSKRPRVNLAVLPINLEEQNAEEATR